MTSVERNSAVLALVERCRSITWVEATQLAREWARVEDTENAPALIAEARRIVSSAGPEAERAAEAADQAYRSTIRNSSARHYFGADPIYGRTVAAIRMRAMAVAAGAAIPAELAAKMSDPWQAVIEVGVPVDGGRYWEPERTSIGDVKRGTSGADLYWGMGPFDPPQHSWLIAPDEVYAHLYKYESPGEDPDLPRCDQSIHRSTTRPAIYGDHRCPDCDSWFEYEVLLPAMA